jgi:hypothetical protein
MLFVALFGPLRCMLGDQPFRVLETTDIVWLFGDKADLVQSESLWRDVGSSVPLFAYWLLVRRLHCFCCRVCGGLHKSVLAIKRVCEFADECVWRSNNLLPVSCFYNMKVYETSIGIWEAI